MKRGSLLFLLSISNCQNQLPKNNLKKFNRFFLCERKRVFFDLSSYLSRNFLLGFSFTTTYYSLFFSWRYCQTFSSSSFKFNFQSLNINFLLQLQRTFSVALFPLLLFPFFLSQSNYNLFFFVNKKLRIQSARGDAIDFYV